MAEFRGQNPGVRRNTERLWQLARLETLSRRAPVAGDWPVPDISHKLVLIHWEHGDR
jgi:hypothetical protein